MVTHLQEICIFDAAEETLRTIRGSIGSAPAVYWARFEEEFGRTELVSNAQIWIEAAQCADDERSKVLQHTHAVPISVLNSPNSPLHEYFMSLQRGCSQLKERRRAHIDGASAQLSLTCKIFSDDPILTHVQERARIAWAAKATIEDAKVEASFNECIEKACKRALPQRRRRNLPPSATQVLTNWLEANSDHPYATEGEKEELASLAGITVSQVANWLSNRRNRE
jgi:hypothetical protein